MDEKELRKQRYALVVKSNDIIQKSRFALSLVEQRIILFLISKIQMADVELSECEFELKDFCQICGIDYKNNLTQLKDAIKNLADKSTWITLSDQSETLVRWIEKPYISKNSGKVRICLDRDMMPYLLQMKENFTRYELIAILALKSKFSIRIYELLKSHEYLQSYEFSVEELRKSLMLEDEYPVTSDFKRYVIDKSIDEINTFTDLDISYKAKKNSRKIIGFTFCIRKRESWDGEYHAANLFLNKKLPTRHKQMRSLESYRKRVEKNEF